jgi:hypothetical protein
MGIKGKSKLVPQQQTGKPIDATSAVELPGEENAKTFFNTVKRRLQDINRWKDYAGEFSADFQLVDKTGVEVQRTIQKGDFFKIDIPGPGSKSGGGYDWVQVEEVENFNKTHSQMFGFRVRPTDNPQDPDRGEDVAHFYSHRSTSSFVVEREKNKVTASVYDRNTKPNMDAGLTTDKIRDAVIGAVGVISFSKLQWQRLTDGLIRQ